MKGRWRNCIMRSFITCTLGQVCEITEDEMRKIWWEKECI
jgi:hypothetical protein